MADRIKLVSGDTRPQVYVALRDRKTGNPIDVSNAELAMNFRAQGATQILSTLTGVKLPGTVDVTTGIVNDAAAGVGQGGRAVFSWPPGGIDVPAGYYDGEIVISFSDGSVQTVYDKVKFRVRDETGG